MQRNWSSLIRPKRIDVDEATHTNFYGEFTISLWKEDSVSRWATP